MARSSLWRRRLLTLVAVLGHHGELRSPYSRTAAELLQSLQQGFNDLLLLEQRLWQFSGYSVGDPLGDLDYDFDPDQQHKRRLLPEPPYRHPLEMNFPLQAGFPLRDLLRLLGKLLK
jgi:hypothetical protein